MALLAKLTLFAADVVSTGVVAVALVVDGAATRLFVVSTITVFIPSRICSTSKDPEANLALSERKTSFIIFLSVGVEESSGSARVD